MSLICYFTFLEHIFSNFVCCLKQILCNFIFEWLLLPIWMELRSFHSFQKLKILLVKFGSFFRKSIPSYNLDYVLLKQNLPIALHKSNEKNCLVQINLFFSHIFICQTVYKSNVNFSLFTHFKPQSFFSFLLFMVLWVILKFIWSI
jgi:hypothetical protein